MTQDHLRQHSKRAVTGLSYTFLVAPCAGENIHMGTKANQYLSVKQMGIV